MNINFPCNIANTNKIPLKNTKINHQKDNYVDSFINSKNSNISNNLSFTGNILSKLFKKDSVNILSSEKFDIPPSYAADLSIGIKNVMGCDIPSQNFANIISPNEFKEILPTLSSQNFLKPTDNILNHHAYDLLESLKEDSKEGINNNSNLYSFDLDYQSNFSKGKENVFNILEDITEYADKYYEENNKPFVFALTDRDSVEGIQHIIKIVGSNPEKYKHLKIIPAIKISFAHEAPTSNIGFENSDMIIYGINPFSQNIINFVDETIEKRRKMMLNFIQDINTLYPEFSFKIKEFAQQNNIEYRRDLCISNLYWRAREYAEMKAAYVIKTPSKVSKDIIKEANDFLAHLDERVTGSDEKGYSISGTTFLKNEPITKDIKEVFYKYATHINPDDKQVYSPAEALFNDMINCLSKERQKPVLALADAFYYTHFFGEKDSNKFEKVSDFFNGLKQKSNGMLLGFESISPKYFSDLGIDKEQLKNFNKKIREATQLYEVGGSWETAK